VTNGDLTRRLARPAQGWSADELLQREWLVTNGTGAYAGGTLAGVNTRSYHGLLTAALPAPLGRLLMLKQIAEHVTVEGRSLTLNDDAMGGDAPEGGGARLAEFRLENGLPVWHYELDGFALERRIVMPQRQNTVYVVYRVLEAPAPLQLALRPWVQYRTHDNPLLPHAATQYTLTVNGTHYEVSTAPGFPVLRMMLSVAEARFVVDGGARRDVFLRVEADRGYEALNPQWSPGFFSVGVQAGQSVAVVASSEPWNAVEALSPDEAFQFERERRRRLLNVAPAALRGSPFEELVLAADQFIATPAGRIKDAIRARAEGDRLRSIMAGYHWFADWGRDTMISLEGLTLTTGRHLEAAWILRTFNHYVRHGLLPNFFPEGRDEGLYHTADATLWFFHAIDRYVTVTNDRTTLRLMLPTLHDIVRHHVNGTRYGIGVDPDDGLLRQGAEGYQLTWMDAKVGDWVVTPRRGKAVEINALWYNALMLLARWTREEEQNEPEALKLESLAGKARASFNRRFWYAPGGYCYDVVDGERGDDASCRPNQLLGIALPHPVLEREYWAPVVDVVRSRLLTPVGLRSLAPGDPNYKPRYFGDLRARDAAYHQGTVWGWLIGPFIDAWLALNPGDGAGARKFLDGFVAHLDDAAIGSISEIFDAEAPFTPRGCVAQAWSVAEVLRCWVKTAGGPTDRRTDAPASTS
jgi:predicted glycogen debranching enzyme